MSLRGYPDERYVIYGQRPPTTHHTNHSEPKNTKPRPHPFPHPPPFSTVMLNQFQGRRGQSQMKPKREGKKKRLTGCRRKSHHHTANQYSPDSPNLAIQTVGPTSHGGGTVFEVIIPTPLFARLSLATRPSFFQLQSLWSALIPGPCSLGFFVQTLNRESLSSTPFLTVRTATSPHLRCPEPSHVRPRCVLLW